MDIQRSQASQTSCPPPFLLIWPEPEHSPFQTDGRGVSWGSALPAIPHPPQPRLDFPPSAPLFLASPALALPAPPVVRFFPPSLSGCSWQVAPSLLFPSLEHGETPWARLTIIAGEAHSECLRFVVFLSQRMAKHHSLRRQNPSLDFYLPHPGGRGLSILLKQRLLCRFLRKNTCIDTTCLTSIEQVRHVVHPVGSWINKG